MEAYVKSLGKHHCFGLRARDHMIERDSKELGRLSLHDLVDSLHRSGDLIA
jgi:hypothetical protein